MKIQHLYESSISSKWAINDNVIYGTDPYKRRIRYGAFDDASIIWVNIKDAFEHTEEDLRLDINDPLGGINSIKNRVPQAKAQFNSGYMNPSEVGYNEYRKAIMFGDGRHRLVAAYQLGEEYAPVIVSNSEIPNITKLIRTKGHPVSFDAMKEILST